VQFKTYQAVNFPFDPASAAARVWLAYEMIVGTLGCDASEGGRMGNP